MHAGILYLLTYLCMRGDFCAGSLLGEDLAWLVRCWACDVVGDSWGAWVWMEGGYGEGCIYIYI